MKDLYKIKLEEGIKLKENPLEYDDDGITLGYIHISAEHDQDCCEYVRADFSVMKDYINEINSKEIIYSIRIKGVEDEGFVIFFNEELDKLGVFIPCYNYQNGYYSNELILNIAQGETVTSIDLQEAKVVYNQ